MKRYIEKLAAFYHRRYELKVALLRPMNVYGPYDKFDPAIAHVLPARIGRAEEREDPFEVWGDRTATRDFIYVVDMVEAILRAVERAADGKPVNFSTGKLVTIRESVELILKLTGHAPKDLRFDPSKPTTIAARRLDLSHSKKRVGYSAAVPFEEGLRRTIDWYLTSSKAGAAT